ncbi:MAG: beta-galactosidase [Victivallales bacterium]
MLFTRQILWLSLVSFALSAVFTGYGEPVGSKGETKYIGYDNGSGHHPFSKTIFSGGSLYSPVCVSMKKTTVSYSRKCPYDDAEAFVQINFGRTTGSIWLSNLTVSETRPDGTSAIIYHTSFTESDVAGDKPWRMHDAGKIGMAATVDGTAIRIDVPKRVEFPWDAQVCTRPLRLDAGKIYTVSFDVRTSREAWPITSYLMRMNPLRFYAMAGDDVFSATVKAAEKEGVRTFAPCITIPWERDLAQNRYEMLDQYIEELIALAPGCNLILRFGVEPPAWWQMEHKEEMAAWENGRVSKYVSAASVLWRRDAACAIHAAITHLEGKWGGNIAGYCPLAQSTGEWYYPIWDNEGDGGMDFSVPYRLGYQAFLEKKYGEAGKLNQAWGGSFKTFSEVCIPTEVEKSKAELGQFRNPKTQRRLIDFGEYQQDAMSTAIEDICAAIKDASGGKHVMGFYGYTFELSACQTGVADTGHLNLGRLLKSPYVDGFVNIISYSNRGVKGTSSIMCPTESISLHGKLAIMEDDTRTHLSEATSGYERTENSTETGNVLLRNHLRALIHGMCSWKFDLYSAGWFNDPQIWKKLITLERTLDRTRPSPSFPSDVAVVVDERSFLALKPGIELTKPLISDLRFAIDRMGTSSASWWLLDDLIDDKIPPHKMTIILNAFLMSHDQVERIRSYFERHGGMALYLYAPGYLTDDGPSLENMKRLTGFTFDVVPDDISSKIVPAQPATGMFADVLRTMSPMKLPVRLAPRFHVLPEKNVQALSTYQDSPLIASAVRKSTNYTSVFHAPPTLSPETLAALAVAAGVHAYAPPGNVVVTDGTVLSVTAARAGPLQIRLPKRCDIADLHDQSFHRQGVEELTLEMADKETRFLVLDGALAGGIGQDR